MTEYKSVIIILIYLLSHTAVLSQHTNNDSTNCDLFVKEVEKIYGADDLLINGVIFFPRSPLIEGHPYFQSDEWLPGEIFIRGRSFKNMEIKYNLEIDHLILNAFFQGGANVKIVLNTTVIDSFYIGDHFFMNRVRLLPGESATTFYEVVYCGDFLLLSKYAKEYIPKYSVSHPYGNYSKQYTTHYILKQGALTAINSKRSLLTFFEPYKEEIKRFMKKNHLRFKKSDGKQMKQLMTFIGSMIKG
jgi:hypothetical protein